MTHPRYQNAAALADLDWNFVADAFSDATTRYKDEVSLTGQDNAPVAKLKPELAQRKHPTVAAAKPAGMNGWSAPK